MAEYQHLMSFDVKYPNIRIDLIDFCISVF